MKYLAIALLLSVTAATLAAPPATRPAKPAPGGDPLKTRLDDIDFAGLTAREAIDAIAAKTGRQISVNFKALEAGGAATAKVRGRLMDVTVRQAIQHVIAEFDIDKPVEVRIDQTQYVFTAHADSDRVETRVYNVAAQLERLAAEQAAQLPKNTPANQLRLAAVDRLASLITQHVAPDSWRDAGGTDGSLSISGTRLTVTNRSSALRALEAYLKELDKPRR